MTPQYIYIYVNPIINHPIDLIPTHNIYIYTYPIMALALSHYSGYIPILILLPCLFLWLYTLSQLSYYWFTCIIHPSLVNTYIHIHSQLGQEQHQVAVRSHLLNVDRLHEIQQSRPMGRWPIHPHVSRWLWQTGDVWSPI